MCTALVRRVQSLDLLDEEASGDPRILEIRQYVETRQWPKREAEDRPLYSQATPEKCMDTKMQWEQEDKRYEPVHLFNGSRVDRAVQVAFCTIDVDDSSHFTGDLSKTAFFDIWEK